MPNFPILFTVSNDSTATVISNFELDISSEWATSIVTFESGKEQRKPLRSREIAVFTLRFPGASEDDTGTLFDFFKARKGRYGKFTVTHPYSAGVTLSMRYDDDLSEHAEVFAESVRRYGVRLRQVL